MLRKRFSPSTTPLADMESNTMTKIVLKDFFLNSAKRNFILIKTIYKG